MRLPDVTDAQGKILTGLRPLISSSQLTRLQEWLNGERPGEESARLPAWGEIVNALLCMTTEALTPDTSSVDVEDAASGDQAPPCLFLTHSITHRVKTSGGKVASTGGKFVTDQASPLLKNLRRFFTTVLESEGSDSTVPILGWVHVDGKDGLGFALATPSKALDLYQTQLSDDSGSSRVTASQFGGLTKKIAALFSDFPLPAWSKFPLIVALLVSLAYLGYSTGVGNDDLLSEIQRRGSLACGVDGSLEHFSDEDIQRWWGIDVELCKALAAAVGVDSNFERVNDSDFATRIATIESGEIDILFRNTSSTIDRNLTEGISFGPTYFYEWEYYLDIRPEPANGPIVSEDLAGHRICVKPGTSNEQSLVDIAEEVDITIINKDASGKPLSTNVQMMAIPQMSERLCDFIFGNYYVLSQIRADLATSLRSSVTLRKSDFQVLEPLAPVLPVDSKWEQVVSHVIYGLFFADVKGITSYNVDEKLINGTVSEREFLGGYGIDSLGLDNEWVLRVIQTVGNYSEIYYRSMICDGYCPQPPEEDWHREMQQRELQERENENLVTRWPNKVFRPEDERPGLLLYPRF